jgi:hypothetical protein
MCFFRKCRLSSQITIKGISTKNQRCCGIAAATVSTNSSNTTTSDENGMYTITVPSATK